MKEIGLTPPTATSKTLRGHGQDRSIPRSPRTTSRASPSSKALRRVHAPGAALGAPRHLRPRRMAASLRAPVAAALVRRLGRLSGSFLLAMASGTRGTGRRADGPGIRQADGRDRDRRASRRCRARSMSAPSSGSTSATRSTTTARNDKGIGIQLAYSLARVRVGYLLAVAGGGAARLPDRHVAADEPGARSLHPGAEADLAAGLDAARALHHQGFRACPRSS